MHVALDEGLLNLLAVRLAETRVVEADAGDGYA
jgi:hypothetical protein